MPQKRKSGFVHEVEGGENKTDHWLTPPRLVQSMGAFDLDPCAYRDPRSHLAATNYCLPDNNGLLLPWKGSVYCNPPYGKELGRWIERCSLHNDAVMLMYLRGETLSFRGVWKWATAVLVLYSRIAFINPETMLEVNGGGGRAASWWRSESRTSSDCAWQSNQGSAAAARCC